MSGRPAAPGSFPWREFAIAGRAAIATATPVQHTGDLPDQREDVMSSIRADARIRRKVQVAYHTLSETGEGVVLHLQSGQYHGLNRMGAVIWGLLDGSRTVSGLVRELRGLLAEPPPDLEADVMAFLHDLLQRDLIETLPPSE